jgi:tetratricopeptide (TPR) repeat protein
MRRFLLMAAVFCLARAQGQTVVVLPFSNLSGASSLDWIGESASETIREALSAEGVLVLDRESREEAYRRLSLRPSAQLTLASAIKAGDVLDAERVVYGSFEATPSPSEASSSEKTSLKLTVRTLDLRKMKQGEEQSASGAMQDLGDIENRLAWLAVQGLLPPGRAPSEEQFLRRRKPVRLDALESYIRGLLATSTEQKHRFFTQAARLDAGFSQPCFQLGRLLWSGKNYSVAAGWLERVSADSPNAVEAQFLLGLCRYALGDFEKAESSFRVAVGFVPLNEVWNNLGAAQSRRNLPEAVESFRKAFEGDPNDPAYRFNLGYALWKKGEFQVAADTFRTVLDLTPEDPQAILMLGRCLKKTPANGVAIKIEGFERIKNNFEEMAYRQLRATLERKSK